MKTPLEPCAEPERDNPATLGWLRSPSTTLSPLVIAWPERLRFALTELAVIEPPFNSSADAPTLTPSESSFINFTV